MELLLPKKICYVQVYYRIYIPIWSYFYHISEALSAKFIKIYIPIWSYFYVNIFLLTSLNFIFTFQYGATSTCACSNCKFVELSFTFQYGATSTRNSFHHFFDIFKFTFQYGATSTVMYLSKSSILF